MGSFSKFRRSSISTASARTSGRIDTYYKLGERLSNEQVTR
jgi:hypothetical protein